MTSYEQGRVLVLQGLPGYPQTIAGVKGWDYEERRMWFAPVVPAGDGTPNSAPIDVPDHVPYIKTVTADELLTDEAIVDSIHDWNEYPASRSEHE